MYNDDYIIAVDENGQPYIAHAWGDRWKNYKHKYLEKVRTKTGIWRYLYTPEEVKAYYDTKKYGRNKNMNTEELQKYQNARYKAEQAKKRTTEARKDAAKRAGKAVDDLGIDDAVRYANAKRRGVKSTEDLQKYQNAEYQWKNSKLGRASSSVKKYGKTTLSSIKNSPSAARDKIKDWLGYDEREARDKAHQALVNGSYNDRTKAGKEHHFKETQAAYEKTLLGKYDKWNSKRKVRNASKKKT